MENTNENKTAEQLASEQNLSALIDENGAENLGGTESPQMAADGNAENAIYGLLSIVPIGLSMAGLKNTAAVWHDDVCKGVAGAMLPVLKKYVFGKKIIAFLETGGGVEELGLALVLFPVVTATAGAHKADMSLREKEVKDAPPESAKNDATN